MAEPKANVVSLHPIAPEAKVVFSLFDEKVPAKTNCLHQPLLQCSPTHHAVSYHQLGLQTAGGPGHYTEVKETCFQGCNFVYQSSAFMSDFILMYL